MLTCGGWVTAKRIVLAMSSGSRTLSILSIIFSIAATTAGFSLWPWSSVSTQPGSIAVTRTPARAHSCRSASEKPTTPHFVML